MCRTTTEAIIFFQLGDVFWSVEHHFNPGFVFLTIILILLARALSKFLFVSSLIFNILHSHHDFFSYINPFQTYTLHKVMAGCHFGSEVTGQNILPNPCSRSILLCGMLRKRSKHTCHYVQMDSDKAQDN